MRERELLKRIILNSNDTVGKPIIKGTQLTVEYILGLLAHGTTEEEIFQKYEGLTHEDILACMLFAAKALETTFFMPLVVRAN
jgi:uncharacterized protein (DUF433 family)